MAARDALRFSGLGRLVGALARETAKSARTQAIVNLAAARATILARAKRDETSEPPKGIRRPLRDVVAKAESVAGDAKRDGLRAGQLAKDVDDRAAASAGRVAEMIEALDGALDMSEREWSIERTLERLGKLAVDAEKRGGEALRVYGEHAAELEMIAGAHHEGSER
jgi:hypothetical protein